MANRPKSDRTKQRDEVEALMVALLTQIRAETTDAINLALRRHDERYHLPSVPSPLVGLTGEPL